MGSLDSKSLVFIISGGRTGTKFLGDLMSVMISGSFSVHEPDVVSYFDNRLWNQIKTFGIYHLFIGKILRTTGIRNLSEKFIANKVTEEEARRLLLKYREKYYAGINESLIIESYAGWYGLVPVIRKAIPNHKFIVLYRSPKSWINSYLSWGTMYGDRDWLTKIGLERLNPKMINDLEYADQWKSFTLFQKLCWAYKTINEVLLTQTHSSKDSYAIKYEDLFVGRNKTEELDRLLDFVAPSQKTSFDPSIFNQRINTSPKQLTKHVWSDDMYKDLERICGDTIKKLGYNIN